MKNICLTTLICFVFPLMLKAQTIGPPKLKKNIPLDSIVLSDPFILADSSTHVLHDGHRRDVMEK